MRISWKQFGGIMPKVSARNLPDICGQTAQNCWLAETTLEPIHAASTGSPTYYTVPYYQLLGYDAVNGPIADDQYTRVYYTTSNSTLHMHASSGSTSDVSMDKPDPPTITKTLLFTPPNVAKFTGNYAHFSTALRYDGYSIIGSVVRVNFIHPAAASIQTRAGTYQLQINGLYYDVPSSLEHVIFQEDGVDATLQVVDVECTEISPTSQATTGAYLYGEMRVVFVCRITSRRSSVQYQYYVQTKLNSQGQESPPSEVSTMVEWGILEKIKVSSNLTRNRLYRSATGTTDSDFFFVAENTGSNYVDTKTDAELAEKMPLIENPPTKMNGLVSMPGGFLAAFYKKDIYFSEPWLPYSWPTRYRLTIDYDVVGLAVQGNDLVVLTKGNPYYISGTHPEIMSQTRLPINQSCVSKKSIAFAERFVCYASPDGLVSLTGGKATIITQDLYTRDQWNDLSPSSMVGALHDRRYIGFTTGTTIIVDFMEGNAALTTSDITATAAASDLETDYLYLSSSRIWRGSSTATTATWKSKEYQNAQDAIWTCAKVIASTYTAITFKIFADGTQVWSTSVRSSDAFRVPKFSRSARWAIQLETKDVIHEVVVASTMNELRVINELKP